MKFRLWLTLAAGILMLTAGCTATGTGGHAASLTPAEPSAITLAPGESTEITVVMPQALPGDNEPPSTDCLDTAQDLGGPLPMTAGGTQFGIIQIRQSAAPGCQAVWLEVHADQSLASFRIRLMRLTACDAIAVVPVELDTTGTQSGDTLIGPRLGYDSVEKFFAAQYVSSSGGNSTSCLTAS